MTMRTLMIGSNVVLIMFVTYLVSVKDVFMVIGFIVERGFTCGLHCVLVVNDDYEVSRKNVERAR